MMKIGHPKISQISMVYHKLSQLKVAILHRPCSDTTVAGGTLRLQAPGRDFRGSDQDPGIRLGVDFKVLSE